MRARGEEGKSNLTAIIVILLVILGAYVILKLLPVKIDAYALEDKMAEMAKYEGFQAQGDQNIQRGLMRKAQELGLPLQEKNIRITRPPGKLVIEVNYTVDVAFIGGYVYSWDFHSKVDVPSLGKLR